MPTRDEILAVLDVLWNSKTIRSDYELRADNKTWQESQLPRAARFFGKFPTRKTPSKNDFEADFYLVVEEALCQAERIRASQKLDEIYPVNACSVALGAGRYAVEVFYKRNKPPDLIEGFDSIGAADAWIHENAAAYAMKKGSPPIAKLVVVGDIY